MILLQEDDLSDSYGEAQDLSSWMKSLSQSVIVYDPGKEAIGLIAASDKPSNTNLCQRTSKYLVFLFLLELLY